ncbi:MAG: peptidylprolyl isomerase [Thioalkalivibrio sp.]|nr:MAG: peptidylprolyl isomerase [Thioalkalivibrio sp.]
MKTRIPLILLAPLLLILTACDRTEPETEPPVADAETLALVNGVPITRTDLFTYVGLGEAPETAGTEDLLEELVNLELLRQQAVAEGIHEEEETRVILRNIETNILASELLDRRTEAMQFSEAEIQAEYDEQVADLASEEYRARHILVPTQELAQELIEELDAGADFAELAEAHSIDASAPEGGDLGWFPPQQMVAPFAEAVTGLEPGEYTPEPVETQFGWHVIQLEDTRTIEPPSLDEVRPVIEEILETRRLRAYIDELRADARIEFPLRPHQ